MEKGIEHTIPPLALEHLAIISSGRGRIVFSECISGNEVHHELVLKKSEREHKFEGEDGDEWILE